MCGFSKNQARLHKKVSLLIVVIYLVIITSVDLFHTENCVFSSEHRSTRSGIFSNDPCPACAFSVGHNSTGMSQDPVLLNVENLFISQFLPHLEVVRYNEWASSIVSRAPPSTSIS
jgi:hypothetical protein